MKHKPECYSGTAPWDKCFCKSEKDKVYKCECGWSGTERGLKVHKSIVHKKVTNPI